MNFTTNTKPFAEALNLGIINANVANYHKKSNIVQLTADAHTLRINVEASQICSQMLLKGAGDTEQSATIFVSSLLLKQLVATLESATVILEFAENGLVIHSGKSKYTLPKMVDASDIELTPPKLLDSAAVMILLDKSDWKFIKDRQLFAIAMSFVHPVYTKVWIGAEGDVIVGDYDNSVFTHSTKNKLGSTCLLSDTIVNLFTCLPDGAKICKSGKDYIITYECDSFSYVTQFTPFYEDDEGVGSYNSEIFLTMMTPPASGLGVSPAALSRILGQAELLGGSSDDTITLAVKENTIHISDKNIDCDLPIISGVATDEFTITFKTESLKKVISNYTDEKLEISAFVQDDTVGGLLIWTNELVTIIGGAE